MKLVRDLISETFRRNRLLATVAALHLALFVLLIPLSFLDSMQLLGISRWLKPMKFAISISIFLATMAWILEPLQENSGRAVRIISRIMAFTMGAEMILITMQSARGVRSHFNHETPFDDAVFSVMGVLIVLNTIAAGYALFLFYRRPVTASGAYLAGIRCGLLIFILASLEGGLMATLDTHSVGLHDGGPGLPFVNWSTGGGDLRVAHFVGMHALQALPLFGWLLFKRGIENGRRLVHVAAALWLTITGLLVAQAMAGKAVLAVM